ncbi:glycoside hydrolase family 2 protein [Lederbergia sp. NSJ-179]|uniref:beta-mannosidase n=1 Tax=Lederbergia sp. NSJ-179 TaxID=2931402 RepID=UPI001FD00E20|nr:glycoside hydrolase family 2 protein [Lederbergia sp. NSJ-179]MCJ7840165.1 glycoside hydrolase family 2 protein [Lederbergia sp. NSJ-179]
MAMKKLVLSKWKFKQSDRQDWLPAKVPGCVHTDLLRNKQIPDPFYGKNEVDSQWIDKQDWEYQTSFNLPEEVFGQSNIELVFDGLDTYAEVYLNEEHLLSANNMFRSWKVNIKSFVRKENNRLQIYFRSPIQEDLVKLEKLGYDLPASNDHSEDGGLGDKKVSVFARKAPYHYGWDWGPRFVTSGIWKEVRIESWSELRIADLFIQQKKVDAEKAVLTAVIDIQSDQQWNGKLKLTSEDLQLDQSLELQAGKNVIEVDFSIEHPKLWWSRGLGEQNFYSFTASLIEKEKVVTEKSIRTGLRSIRLVRDKDSLGTSFYIELNGVPVFAKGANHIPNDSFETEVTYERYRHEIASAAEANMNMLRVWGGGIYEYEDFYHLCDEYGILVWQDFMFACSMYPGDEAFLDNVRAEAEENVKRLRNHPSIALWCGNNEIDAAWAHYDEKIGWGWKQQYTPEIREEIWSHYEAIFHRVLPEVIEAYAPGAAYWPSSPMNDLSGTASQHSRSTSTGGDIHYWDVWHGLKPLEDYKQYIGRFMSEYGFQSFPELKTVQTYAEEKDMALESDVMLHHQKNDAGNRLIKEYMEMYFKEPQDFPSFLYMSHILQAEAMKMAIEAHRMKKPYCMGTLFWQMNDCWPVASWASMDYYGRWKAVQYIAKRSYQDVAVMINGAEKTVEVHLISDILSEVLGTLTIQLFDFKGNCLYKTTKDVILKANAAQTEATLQAEELLKGLDANKVVLCATLESEGQIIDQKEYYFKRMKEIDLSQPTITIEEVEESNGTEFILNTDFLAKNVWLDVDQEGIFNDNYFDLIPGIPKKVSFFARSNQDQPFVLASPRKIIVQSMVDFIKQD